MIENSYAIGTICFARDHGGTVKEPQVVITDQSQGIATLTIRGWVERADVITTKERLAMQGLEALKHAGAKLPPPMSNTGLSRPA